MSSFKEHFMYFFLGRLTFLVFQSTVIKYHEQGSLHIAEINFQIFKAEIQGQSSGKFITRRLLTSCFIGRSLLFHLHWPLLQGHLAAFLWLHSHDRIVFQIRTLYSRKLGSCELKRDIILHIIAFTLYSPRTFTENIRHVLLSFNLQKCILIAAKRHN